MLLFDKLPFQSTFSGINYNCFVVGFFHGDSLIRCAPGAPADSLQLITFVLLAVGNLPLCLRGGGGYPPLPILMSPCFLIICFGNPFPSQEP